MADNTGSVTRLLQAWSLGDESAMQQLAPLIYSELRAIAAGLMRRERPGHTLRPTELVHEAFLRLVDQQFRDYDSRTHFFAIASRHMRQILVDHARKRGRIKRGGGRAAAGLDGLEIAAPDASVDLLALDDALSELTNFDERKSHILEMHYFGGMTQEEIASALGVHGNTVARDLRLARAWLQSRLRIEGGQTDGT